MAAVASHCTGAMLINLTNPAGIVTQAARIGFGLDVISVCDSPLDLLAAAGGRLGLADATRLRARDVGMNHVGWDVAEASAELDPPAGPGARLAPPPAPPHRAPPRP